MGKPRQKKSEKAPRKHTKIKDWDKKGSCETMDLVPPIQEQPATPTDEDDKSNYSSQPSDISLSGFSTGHVHSTQLSSCITQEDSPDNKPLLSCPSMSALSQNSAVQKESKSIPVPLPPNANTEPFKISTMGSQFSNVFQVKESNAAQNAIPKSFSRTSQVIQSPQFILNCSPFVQEDPTEVQKRLLASVGKLRDTQNVPDTMPFEKLQSKLLPCTMNSQQQLTGLQDSTKHSDSSSSESQFSKSSLVTSLKSPIKIPSWKEKGELFDGTEFTSQKLSQNFLPNIFSGTKTLQNSTKAGSSQGILDVQSGIAVLKELLHKKQQKVTTEGSHIKPKSIQSNQTEPKCANMKSATPNKKPRTPRSTKPKAAKNLKMDLVKYQSDQQLKSSISDGSPGIFSETDFESCYSLEDSLSPEHAYFDINSVGLCSSYTGSQFISADQHLPQKFLSDPVPCQAIDQDCVKQENQETEKNVRSLDRKVLIRPSSLSPDMFEKSSVDIKMSTPFSHWKNGFLTQKFHSASSTAFTQQSETSDSKKPKKSKPGLLKEASFIAPRSEWVHSEMHTQNKESASDTCSHPNSNSSFIGLASSPENDFIDGDLELFISRHSDGLIATPYSSPRSICSPSQSKNGSATPRPVHILKPLMSPPSREEIMATLLDHDLMETVYQEPFFSNPSDAPEKPREVGGKTLTVETKLAHNLSEFEGDFSMEGLKLWKTAFSAMTQNPKPISPGQMNRQVTEQATNEINPGDDKKLVVMPCKSAPPPQKVQLWLQAKELYESSKTSDTAPLTQVTNDNKNTTITVVPSGCNSLPPKEINILLAQPASLEDQPVNEENLKIHIASPPPSLHGSDGEDVEGGIDVTVEDEIESTERTNENDGCISPNSSTMTPWQNFDHKQSPRTDDNCADNYNPSSPTEECGREDSKKSLKTVKSEIQALSTPSPPPFKQKKHKSKHACLHSTPVTERRIASPDVIPLTPVTIEARSQKMSQRRGTNPDKLRRVLLTTQMKNQFAALGHVKKETSQIEGPSLNNSYGFKVSSHNLQDAKALHEVQHLTLMGMELHARTRRDLEPDPEFDPICALFYCLSSDSPLPQSDKTRTTGAIVISQDSTASEGRRSQAPLFTRSGITGFQITYASDEKDLFQKLLNLIRRYDPDILLGYEVQMHSWGYLLQRASALNVDLCKQISRIPEDKNENRFTTDKDEYGAATMSEINVVPNCIECLEDDENRGGSN
ncbi:unnamed protein product [Staurois parvus]|uniref:DNA-directed DNA polymerase family B exonuclease domain-containing protein n=1 Tax=Staurois parvus TaxID=386267 RepID=A0ABN9D5Q3_9NEOB|nr:unnamed protein product [Staurois parvus]